MLYSKRRIIDSGRSQRRLVVDLTSGLSEEGYVITGNAVPSPRGWENRRDIFEEFFPNARPSIKTIARI